MRELPELMMLRAAALAAFSALLGGGLALAARRRPSVLERTRTFAFAAAAGVVAFHLLPEVLPGQGLAALLWIGAGFALPWVLEAGSRALGPGLLQGRGFSNFRVAAEVGFAALIFHSVVEGLALVAALAQPRGQLDLEIALVAHHAPLTAAVVLPFLELKGSRSVAMRSLAVAAAGVLGAVLSGAVPGLGEGALLQKATAVTAGALLHVVSDEIRAQRFGSRWERAADLGACVVGLLVAGVGAALHLREAAPMVEFLRVLAGSALACAPALLFGAVAGAVLAAHGVPLPLQRTDALLLAAALLGPVPAIAVLAVKLLLGRKLTPEPRASAAGALLSAVRERAPSLLALLVVAAALDVAVPAHSPGPFAGGLLLLCVALAARLEEAGAVLIGAVLIRKGFDPGLIIALLAIGAATRSAPLTRARTWGSFLLALAAGWLLSRGGALQSSPLTDFAGLREPVPAQIASSPLGAAAAAALIAIALATLWSAGVRGWFAPLRHGPRTV